MQIHSKNRLRAVFLDCLISSEYFCQISRGTTWTIKLLEQIVDPDLNYNSITVRLVDQEKCDERFLELFVLEET